MSVHRQALLIGLSLSIPATLSAGPSRAQDRPATTVRPGIVVTVEGIGGTELLGPSVTLSLRMAGVPHEVRPFRWTHGTGRFLIDLQDTPHLVKKSADLAFYLTMLHDENPHRPLFVVAKSGGTALVLFALAQMAPGTVDRVVLISAAVAPSFDLRPALRATRGEIVSFHSPNDQLILNWGTSHFGTADRFYGASAGLHGFVLPSDPDDETRTLYRRLVQVRWTPRMLLEGNPGNHLGTGQPHFLCSEITPWLR